MLGAETPVTVRPASLLGDKDLDAARAELAGILGRAPSEAELSSYLMYPKVFAAYAEARARFGPVASLPTPTYFYGMQPGDEVNITIEQGKMLVVALVAQGEVEADGSVRVFFELNGQPRVITVADRKASAGKAVRRMAEAADETHIAAPMPGLVAAVAVAVGQKVKAGDLLLTLEAMKMETPILAPFDGILDTLEVKFGDTVEPKNLIAILKRA